MKRLGAAVTTAAAALVLAAPSSALATGPGAPVWPAPSCTRVTGDGGVTFTTDDGASLAPTTGTLRTTSYTHGLVALDTPGTLLATRNGELQRSTDAGCTWTRVGAVGSGSTRLTAAPGGRAFAWEMSGRFLARTDGRTVTPLTSPTANIVGLGTDRARPDHVRVAGHDGRIYDSVDAGATWHAVGTAAFGGGASVYSVSFDPSDIDHAVAGAMVRGGEVTTDGGVTWRPSTGLSAGSANLFSTVISPASSSVVYGLGIDLAEAVPGSGNEGRHLYRSTDGGRTFAKAVDDTAETKLTNSTLLAASPVAPDVLYFEYGTYYAGYGTDLFRLDAATGKVTKTHNAYDGISAIAFNPGRPSVMYLGVEEVRVD
ncbi:dispase autolysis-inducing protein [Streptomyces sp. VNUA116]|uniref:WD40/YVTN/BNR-like repeat-containing protein n=1 Tax=Streptomyces sp. VNUA116 TaxID=3062449 RepID=UPI0026747DA9|nr:dispase autolysis-inducing protein [Streptomyces sp. VNUA116]WKU42724.1 dispase autolysis-inducing protein [Streptomyces sp. VNUA116]